MPDNVPEHKEVLIVDDQPANLTVLRKMLTEEGFVVRPAINGQIALNTIQATPPDLILLDIMMPEMDGFEVCRRLKEDETTRDIPVIFISALSETVDKLRGFALGAVDYITKPFQSEEVLARVNVHMDLKKNKDHLKSLIREKEEAFVLQRAIFESISDTIVTVDKDLNLISSNKAPEDICPSQGEAEQDFQEKLASGQGPCSQVLLQTLRTRQPVKEYRTSCNCTSNDSQVLVMNCTPLIDSSNIFTGAVLVIRDITRLAELEKDLEQRHNFGNIVGKSETMQKIYLLLEQIADTDINVLITGDSGTGKELIAEAVHFGSSRRDKPLVKVNCAALSENLLESELFGHVRGAFSGAVKDRVGRFEAAEGGTLFLDEVGDIPPNIQIKLLRFLENREFERVGDSKPIKADVRVAAASNQDLAARMKEGLFREDLYYRLKGIVIDLPPLQGRKEDIPLLCGHFLRTFQASYHKHIENIAEDAMGVLLNYSWPGNIRELKQAIEHAVALCPGGWITINHLPGELQEVAEDMGLAGDESFIYSPKFDRETIISTLKKHGGNKARAARELRIGRNTLYRYLDRYNIGGDSSPDQ